MLLIPAANELEGSRTHFRDPVSELRTHRDGLIPAQLCEWDESPVHHKILASDE